MITLLLLLFWFIIARSRFAPWDRYLAHSGILEGVWQHFCVLLMVLTVISVLASMVVHVIPALTVLIQWAYAHSGWLF